MKNIAIVASLVVLVFVFNVAVMAGSSGGKLIIGTPYEPEMLDSQQAHWTIWINALLIRPLIKYDSDMNVVPDLADSVDISPDGKVWTFHIMKGAKFSNGNPVTAETFKETVDRYKKLSPYSSDWDGVESVEAVDEYTVKIINKKVMEGNLVADLVSEYGAPVDVQVANKVGDDAFARDKFIAGGPFKLEKWVSGSYITLARNDLYRTNLPFVENKGPVYLDEITFRFIPEDLTRVSELEAGDVDMITDIPSTALNRLAANPKIQLWSYLDPGMTYLYFNTSKPLFSDVRVRQAVAMAINRDPIIKLLSPLAIPAHTLLSPTQVSYSKEVEEWAAKRYPYDVEAAKKLLADAGWTDSNGDGIVDKDGKPFEFTLLVPTDDPLRLKIDVLIQIELKAIGMKVDLEEVIGQVITDKSRKGDFDAELTWYSWIDPSILYNEFTLAADFYPNDKYVPWHNSESDKLFVEAKSTGDLAKRTAVYSQAQKIVLENAAAVPLFARKVYLAGRDYIRGFKVVGQDYWVNDVTLEK